MKASEIMSSPAITITPETSIQSLTRLMREKQISGLPVVDADGELLGVVTELNLIARNAPVHEPHYLAVLSGLLPLGLTQYRDYKQQLRQVLATTAEQLMTTDVKSITPATELEDLLRLMAHPETILLPVLEANRVVGVVTRTDVVRLIEKLEMTSD